MTHGATLRVSRVPDVGRDLFRSYRIMLDGKLVGKVKRGQSLTVPVDAGVHTLQARIDWCSSKELSFTALETGNYVFQCQPGGSAFSSTGMVFDRDSYIELVHTT